MPFVLQRRRIYESAAVARLENYLDKDAATTKGM